MLKNGVHKTLWLCINVACPLLLMSCNAPNQPHSGDRLSSDRSINEESAAVYDGLRLSIECIEWKGEVLELDFCTTFVLDQDNRHGRHNWAIDPAWGRVYFHFWDESGVKIHD